MIRGTKTYDVELRFDAEFAETIADTRWHSTQEVDWNEDGSIGFRCRVDGLEEIVWWVLSMGPHCIVKQPTELARRVKELAEGVVKNYPSRPTGRKAGKARKQMARVEKSDSRKLKAETVER